MLKYSLDTPAMRSPTDFQYKSPTIAARRSPTDFQYKTATPKRSSDPYKQYGNSRGSIVDRGFDALQKMFPIAKPAAQRSADPYLQYGNSRTGAIPTSSTAEMDGATRIFYELAEAAKKTGMDKLDDLVRGRGGSSAPQQATQASAMPAELAGIPITYIVAVAVVGGVIYAKYG